MLPQGRFQELLTAKTPDRERILATLFATGFYGSIERALREAAGDVRKQREINDVRRADRLRDAQAESREELAAAAEEAASAASEAHAAAARAADADAAARAALDTARRTTALLATAAAATAELAELEGRVAEIGLARAELVAAERAAALADVVGAAAERRAELVAARAEAARLDAKAATAADECEARHAVLAAEEKRAPEREAAAEAARSLEALVARTIELAGLRKQLDEALAGAADKRREADAAAQAWREAAGELATLERLWTTGRAGALSAALTPGEPCPVCGSTEHPAPAEPVEGAPDDDALDAARQAAAAVLARKDELAAVAAAADATTARAEAELKARRDGLPEGAGSEGDAAQALRKAVQARDSLVTALAEATAAARAAETEMAVSKAAAASAGENATACAERSAEADGKLSARLAEAGFADESAWHAAARETARLLDLKTTVDAFDADSRRLPRPRRPCLRRRRGPRGARRGRRRGGRARGARSAACGHAPRPGGRGCRGVPSGGRSRHCAPSTKRRRASTSATASSERSPTSPTAVAATPSTCASRASCSAPSSTASSRSHLRASA